MIRNENVRIEYVNRLFEAFKQEIDNKATEADVYFFWWTKQENQNSLDDKYLICRYKNVDYIHLSNGWVRG